MLPFFDPLSPYFAESPQHITSGSALFVYSSIALFTFFFGLPFPCGYSPFRFTLLHHTIRLIIS